MDRGATFDETHEYRYSLIRRWNAKPHRCLFIMLNPSTADAFQDDNTIRRCIDFAQRWGYGILEVVNLFALRSTDPKAISTTIEPIGERNDEYILEASRISDCIVCAWGAHKPARKRARHIKEILLMGNHRCKCLGTTKEGYPRHPLYVKKETELQLFSGL